MKCSSVDQGSVPVARCSDKECYGLFALYLAGRRELWQDRYDPICQPERGTLISLQEVYHLCSVKRARSTSYPKGSLRITPCQLFGFF